MTKVTHLTREFEPGVKTLVGIKIDAKKETFVIPVLDVRRDRKKVESFIKSGNILRGSKFFKPSYSVLGYSYNTA